METKEPVLTKPHFDPNLKIVHRTEQGGEHDVEFDRIAVVYSNNFSGGLTSRYRPGMTTIDCYKDMDFVGALVFYPDEGPMHGGYIDANGVIVVEFPLSSFDAVMHLIENSDTLSLAYIDTDVDGTRLDHPLGALMTSMGDLAS